MSPSTIRSPNDSYSGTSHDEASSARDQVIAASAARRASARATSTCRSRRVAGCAIAANANRRRRRSDAAPRSSRPWPLVLAGRRRTAGARDTWRAMTERTSHPASRLACERSLDGLRSHRGAVRSHCSSLALASYALQALAWPLERGRDSWDYWLWFLQFFDAEPPFSALEVFRTPIDAARRRAPDGDRRRAAPRARHGPRSTRSRSSAGRGRCFPSDVGVAVATGVVMLINVPFAGLFHEVSSDFVFAALLALFAGWVIRAFSRADPRAASCSSGLGVALLTLCRPTGQVAVIACVLIPLLARGGGGRVVTGIAVGLVAAAIPLGLWAAHNALRYDDFTVARGGKAWVPFFKVARSRRSGERRRVEAAGGGGRARGADPAAVRRAGRRRRDLLPRRGESRGDPDDRALGPGLRVGLRLPGALRRLDRGDPRRSRLVCPRRRRHLLGLPLAAVRPRAARPCRS